jgi:uncharacterized membrane protein YgcG
MGCRSFLVGVVFVALLGHLEGHTSVPPEIPKAPYYYVYDGPKVLNDRTRQAIEVLLVEHDRLTDEQIMIGIFDIKQEDAPSDWVHQVFDAWKVGKRSKNKGILLTVFWKDQKAQIETGYGLESILPRERIDEVMSDSILPSLRRRDIRKALSRGIFDILESLNSPLILSGKAAEMIQILDAQKDIETINDAPQSKTAWITLLGIGILMLGWIFYEILSREAYFTSTGWFHIPPLGWIKTLSHRRKKDWDNQRIGGGTRGTW